MILLYLSWAYTPMSMSEHTGTPADHAYSSTIHNSQAM
jgi:hypothetical protein